MPRYVRELPPVDVQSLLDRLGMSVTEFGRCYSVNRMTLSAALATGEQSTLLRCYLTVIADNPIRVRDAIDRAAVKRGERMEVTSDKYADL